jgi:hypothetical protein
MPQNRIEDFNQIVFFRTFIARRHVSFCEYEIRCDVFVHVNLGDFKMERAKQFAGRITQDIVSAAVVTFG